MFQDVAGHEQLTETIIGCGIKVHEHFGPGLFESVYRQCLILELQAADLKVDLARHVQLHYRGVALNTTFHPDLVIEDTVVVELKAVEALVRVYHAQLVTYLKLTGCPVGLLMNFNVGFLREGIRRLVRPDLYVRREKAPTECVAPEKNLMLEEKPGPSGLTEEKSN